jgi:hypothetical protein
VVLVHEVEVGLHHAADARARRGGRVGERGSQGLLVGGVVAVEDLVEQLLLALEVVEDQRLVHAGALTYVAHAHPLVATLGVQRFGRAQDRGRGLARLEVGLQGAAGAASLRAGTGRHFGDLSVAVDSYCSGRSGRPQEFY